MNKFCCSNKNEFIDIINKYDLVYVYFSSTKCGPCITLKDDIIKIKNANLINIIREESLSFFKSYDIKLVPRLIKYKNNEIINDITGYEEIKNYIKDNYSSKIYQDSFTTDDF